MASVGAEINVVIEPPRIGCIVLARATFYDLRQFVGIQCKKNRGIILPGGK